MNVFENEKGEKIKRKKQEVLIENSFQYSPALLITSVQGFGIDPAEGSILFTFLTDGA